MLSSYVKTLRNEIVSNFGIYESLDDFKFIFASKLDRDIKLNYSLVYEKMFGTKKNYEKYAAAAFKRFYGNSDGLITNAFTEILKGNFDGIKSRSPESLSVLKTLLDVIDIISNSSASNIISSVRDADSEFNKIQQVLSKLTGIFKKEEADKFKIISSIVEYFRNRGIKLFSPLINKYREISESSIDFAEAKKANKKAVDDLFKIFNDKENEYVSTIDELNGLGSSLLGRDIKKITELVHDQVSDEDIDEYTSLIVFYCRHFDSLVDLANDDLGDIIEEYSSIDDSRIIDNRKMIKSSFGDDSIISEKFVNSKEYLFACNVHGRYEDILKFIDSNKIKIFTVLLIETNAIKSLSSNKSLAFLITSLNGDLDDAIDNYGELPDLEIKNIGDDKAVYLLGTTTNNDSGREYAMIVYLSILAVTHGFDAKKLPFVQKFTM